MEKITDRLIKFTNDKKYENLKIIFSSSNTPGEGEHKILQHINKLEHKKNIVVYGLDADLIFLALASHKENIHLLREIQHFGQTSIVQRDDKESLLDVVVKDQELHDECEMDDSNNEKEVVVKDQVLNDECEMDDINLEKDGVDEEDEMQYEELNFLDIDALREKLYEEISENLYLRIENKEMLDENFDIKKYRMPGEKKML